MKTLTLRIYLTLVAVLLLFALVAGLIFQRHLDTERVAADQTMSDRMEAFGDLLEKSLPLAETPAHEQVLALREWSRRLRMQLALEDRHGVRIGASEAFDRRLRSGRVLAFRIQFADGRALSILRPVPRQPAQAGEAAVSTGGAKGAAKLPEWMGGWWDASEGNPWQRGVALAGLLTVLLVAVAAGTWPVVAALTRRLHRLKEGAQRFGMGDLSYRVPVQGRDEVAAVSASFNEAAERLEKMVRSHQSLLANASHELRSPLARMKMALSLWDEAPQSQREGLKRELHANIAELDALVEEVLLASRIEVLDQKPADLLELGPIVTEELDRITDMAVSWQNEAQAVHVVGDERLLRRALRNLFENARRYGGGQLDVSLHIQGDQAVIKVCDRGDGVPVAQRERIFEPFYRLPGHAEKAGGVGLGLSLVQQIMSHHQGSVRCEARSGGGSCFVLALPCEAV